MKLIEVRLNPLSAQPGQLLNAREPSPVSVDVRLFRREGRVDDVDGDPEVRERSQGLPEHQIYGFWQGAVANKTAQGQGARRQPIL